jgi:CheY-like chemotaxis protein
MATQVNRDDGADREVRNAAPGTLLHGVGIMVIDDHEDARQMLAEYFAYTGAAVSVAASGREGLSLYRDALPHVVVTDIAMPTIDGYHVARELRAAARARRRRLRIIAITAFWEVHPELRAVRAGFDAWVTKPVTLPSLAALVVKLTRHLRTAE